MEKILQILSLRIGNFHIGLNIEQVEKIIPAQSVIELSEKPEFLKGLINYFGEVIAVVDLRKRLNISLKDIEVSDKFVIVKTVDHKLVLIVDDIVDLKPFHDEDISISNAIYSGMKFISVLTVSENIVYIYDIDELLNKNETVELESFIQNYSLNVAV